MGYSTPQVTIDLDEYKALLALKEQADTNDTVKMAKTVVAGLINSGGNSARASMTLERQGIRLIITDRRTTNLELGPENIFFEAIKK